MLDVKSLIQSAKEHDFLFFWGHTEAHHGVSMACLSQWYPCSFFEDGQFYNCAEQYMMAQKARLMGDKEVLDQIMNATDPKVIKALGKKVAPFDGDLWNKHKVDVVVRGNKLKFSQNLPLLQYLMSTGDKVLVEASPYDDIWGIGLKETDPEAMDPSKWRGRNLLGFALMEVRQWLKNESEKSTECDSEEEVLCGVTPEKISSLLYNQIFVFGSNLIGKHDGGAAEYALLHFGAKMGVASGLQGRSYAIPTQPATIKSIKPYVEQFLDFASNNPEMHFLVTKIGCGKAGFKVEDIAPLLARAISMKNVSLPKEFIDIIHPKPERISAEERNVLALWTMGLGNSAKAFNGEDPMPSKEKIATAETLGDLHPMPKQHATVVLNHIIPTSVMRIVLCGHIPDAMEDHWFMYCDSTTIRYYRSWTGICVYVANYKIKGDKTVITTLQINRDKNEYGETSDKKDALLFLYLLTEEYGGNGEKYWKQAWGL